MSTESQVQDANLGKAFDALDITKDGIITAEDFDALATQMADRLAPGAAAHRRENILAAFRDWWAQIERDADSDGDGQVSREEFIAATERGLAENPDYLEEAYLKAAESVFEAIDRDGDGQVDRGEYIELYRSADVADDIAGAAFDRIDQNGDGVIDYAEFVAALRELFTSSDPDAPGTGLLG
ncbi:EF-hand domain-containing protein [Crossiella sp. CA-258035]|uniref:EF-hand domain-containing protein n=1 Tax=Crossiella sp. CA-258035 TaxID=2981138 RepID=UPI0024BCB5FA|nr:EF-hand domain-containing protein [Crossiella sp. CA-258035]WHT22173.1 EF-hand domain-containing protein [Crossiella sp. CA-258035]